MLNEANAIRTIALRARMLPEPYASEVRKLLREDVQLRIDVLREPQDQVRSKRRRAAATTCRHNFGSRPSRSTLPNRN